MQLTVIKCDACQKQGELSEEGWSRFSAVFTGETPIDIDVCPECRKRINTALATLVRGQDPQLALESIATVEQRHILAVLTATDWKKSRAAQVLAIERSIASCVSTRSADRVRSKRWNELVWNRSECFRSHGFECCCVKKGL